MEEIHIQRLRRLAEHLSSKSVCDTYKTIEHIKFAVDKSIFFHDNKYYLLSPWFEEELDKIFPADFTRNKKGHVVYIKQPLVSVTFALPEFYNLNTAMFLHCFTVGRQLSEYGRFRMSCNSNPKHCSRILKKFLKVYQSQKSTLENTIIRKVLFEKIRKDAPEKLLKTLINK